MFKHIPHHSHILFEMNRPQPVNFSTKSQARRDKSILSKCCVRNEMPVKHKIDTVEQPTQPEIKSKGHIQQQKENVVINCIVKLMKNLHKTNFRLYSCPCSSYKSSAVAIISFLGDHYLSWCIHGLKVTFQNRHSEDPALVALLTLTISTRICDCCSTNHRTIVTRPII